MSCDDLQKKIQLFTVRIEKQDCFIESLEKEIVRMDSDCMRNYLSWGIREVFNDANLQPKKLDKQISVQSENNFRTLEEKLEDLNRQLKTVSRNTIFKCLWNLKLVKNVLLNKINISSRQIIMFLRKKKLILKW